MDFFFGAGFEIIFFLMFFIVLGIILLSFIRGIAQWNKNNHAPRLTVDATVVSKRINVTHHNQVNAGMHHTYTSTWNYVTFQVESGDRKELQVSGREYGMLVEGDRGKLSFQGTRYLGFERF